MVDTKSSVPYPEQIAEDLRRRIDDGEFSSGHRLPSEDKLGERYGVSRMTARHGLIKLISEGVVERVAGKGTFVASEPASAKEKDAFLSSGVMVLVPNLRHSFYYGIIRGVESVLTDNGYETILRNAEESHAEEGRCLRRLLEGKCRGLVLVAENYSQQNLQLLREVERQMPVAVVDVKVPGLEESDLVVSDDISGGYMATKHLLELGHRRILHVSGPDDDSSARNRLAGYKKALEEHGVEYQEELVRWTSWHRDEGYYEAKKFFLNNSDGATAVFACNDEVGVGVHHALSELDMSVPEDVSIVGYGNIDLGRYLRVPLTTVEQSAEKMGTTATEKLVGKILGKKERAAETVTVPTRLVIRDSCGIREINKLSSKVSCG